MIRPLILCLGLAIAPLQVAAQTVTDSIVAQLGDQGFDQISISRTLLGRTQIVAQSTAYRREIVFNPHTGEILRDYWVRLDGGRSTPVLVSPSGNSGHGGDDEEDDDKDDSGQGGGDDGDPADDDNSGPGGDDD